MLASLLSTILLASAAHANSHGLTFAVEPSVDIAGVELVSCTGGDHECDPYEGDTFCGFSLPVLCFTHTGDPSPDSSLTTWSGGYVQATDPIPGWALTSKRVGRMICQGYFGEHWQMAEFHAGSGWSFSAYGDLDPDALYWIVINDQLANCWDRPLPG